MHFFSLILFLILTVSCNSIRKENAQSTSPADSGAVSIPDPSHATLGPNTCRIVGQIVAVHPPESNGAKGPCTKAPCRATVRIDATQGYGSAFPQPLAEGDEISVTFAFTLHPTEALFPDLNKHYPGLREGSTFLAVLTAHEAPGPTNSSIDYVVYGYDVQ